MDNHDAFNDMWRREESSGPAFDMRAFLCGYVSFGGAAFSLPEFSDFKLFGKANLVVNQKSDFFFLPSTLEVRAYKGSAETPLFLFNPFRPIRSEEVAELFGFPTKGQPTNMLPVSSQVTPQCGTNQ